MAYGDGTKPRQRKDGYWIATVEAGWTERGTRRRRSVTAKTEAECKRRLRTLKRQMLAEAPSTSVSPHTTVRTWADQWLTMQATRVRPKGWATTESLTRRWIIPTIGHRRLSELTAGDVRHVEDTQRAAGLATSTMTRTRAVISKMLADARAEGHSVPQAADAVPPVRQRRTDRERIPVDACARLLASAASRGTWDTTTGRQVRLAAQHDVTRWAVALLTGLRQGEALGLTWDRVDLQAGTIQVDRQLQTIPRSAREAEVGEGWYDAVPLTGRYVLVPIKTAAGERTVPMVPWLAAQMDRWRRECPDSEWGLVWPRRSGGPWSAGDDLAAWRGLQEVAGVEKRPGVPYVLHEARHSTATLLMALQVPAPVVISIMGHSAIEATMRYQHADLEQARAALEGVAGMLHLGEPAQIEA